MKKILLIGLIAVIITMPKCSVYMAAKKSGVSMEDINSCQTKNCLYSKGAILVKSEKGDDIFKAEKPKGSVARAAMHGVLDVATFGVWEVAGTPIEGSMNNKGFNYFKVTYKDNGQDIKAIELAR